jgi:hypothetical protein
LTQFTVRRRAGECDELDRRGDGLVGSGSTVSRVPGPKMRFPGRRPTILLTSRPGRGSKPLSVSGSIRLRAFLDGREAFLIPSLRACSGGVGRFTISQGSLRRSVFTVSLGCVVSAPWLALSPGGFPPTLPASGEGTFLSGRLLPTRTTVSCPPPPGGTGHKFPLDNGCLASSTGRRAAQPNAKKEGRLARIWERPMRGRRPGPRIRPARQSSCRIFTWSRARSLNPPLDYSSRSSTMPASPWTPSTLPTV